MNDKPHTGMTPQWCNDYFEAHPYGGGSGSSSNKYPLPDYAVSVWVAGDNLMVAFPGTRGEQGHTIRLPVSVAGLRTALAILRDRQHARDLRLSNPGTPTQWDLENDKRYNAWLEAMAKAKEEKAKSADETLAELDL